MPTVKQSAGERAAIGRAARGRAAAGFGPDRPGKMRVVAIARDHVPVQVRDGVAQARQVDLVRRKDFAQRGFSREYRVHQSGALGGGQIGHFAYVSRQDHPAEAGIGRVVDQDDAAEPILPQHGFGRTVAQLALRRS